MPLLYTYIDTRYACSNRKRIIYAASVFLNFAKVNTVRVHGNMTKRGVECATKTPTPTRVEGFGTERDCGVEGLAFNNSIERVNKSTVSVLYCETSNSGPVYNR